MTTSASIVTTSAAVPIMLHAVWGGMLMGIISGAVIGLFFHRDDWLGGYSGFRRRMARLGHISFFGLAFVNLGFVLTVVVCGVAAPQADIAVAGFLTGAATMPAVCFLSAWRQPFRHLFFIPVLGVLTGVICTWLGMRA